MVLILETPSTEHIPSLIRGFETGAFSKYWGKEHKNQDHALRVVFHLCGDDVAEHERYKAFMNGFTDAVHVSAFVPVADVGWRSLMQRTAYRCIERPCARSDYIYQCGVQPAEAQPPG